MKLSSVNYQELVKVLDIYDKPLIDWLSITSIRPGKLMKPEQRRGELIRTVNLFQGVSFKDVSATKGTYQMDSTDGSIRIIVNHRYVSIQFKGSFFILHFNEAFEYVKVIYRCLMENSHYKEEICPSISDQLKDVALLNNWLVTRLDIKTDILDKDIPGLLPVPSKTMRKILDPSSGPYRFAFKTGFVTYEDTNEILTGYALKGNDFKLIVYRKDIENSQNKNKRKSSAYDLISKTDKPISRVELRLDGARINAFSNQEFRKIILNGEVQQQEELCQNVLKKFYDKHRVYLDTGKTKNQNEQPEPRWESFFNREHLGFDAQKVQQIKFETSSDLEKARLYLLIGFRKAFSSSCDKETLKKLVLECSQKALKDVKELEDAWTKEIKESLPAVAEAIWRKR